MLAGLKKVPVIVKHDLDEEEAKLIVTETNLVQRSFADLSHSERAVALHMHLEALKVSNGGQGRRTDLLNEIENLANPNGNNESGTSAQVVPKMQSREVTAERYGLNRMNVTRYVRLNSLLAQQIAPITN
jgi:ParB family chromosome partitioning protein